MNYDSDFFSKINVLYVEDEPLIRDLLGEVLKDKFHKVILAENGNDGLAKFKIAQKNNKIDVVISDINMPLMNGLDMIREIKKIDRDIPTIITTAHSDSNFLMEAIGLQISKYVVKPFDPSVVLKNIFEVIQPLFDQIAIKNKTEELEDMFAAVSNIAMIIKIDMEDKITYINNNVLDLFQCSQDDMLNKHLSILKHPDVSESAFGEILSDKSGTKKIKVQTSNGDEHYLSLRFVCTKDKFTDDIIQYTVFCYDITKDEHEKRELKKKLVQNISQKNQQENQIHQTVIDLESIITELRQENNNLKMQVEQLSAQISPDKSKIIQLKNQLIYTEKELKLVSERYEKFMSNSETDKYKEMYNDKFKILSENVEIYKKENIELKKKIVTLSSKLNEEINRSLK